MSSTENRESGGRNLSTADLAAAGRRPAENADRDDELDSAEAERRADERSDASRAAREGADSPGASRVAREGADSPGVTRSAREAAGGPGATRAAGGPGDSPAAKSNRPAAADKPSSGAEQLEPLFTADVADNYRSRWAAVQSSFVDDPRSAVRQGDELVAQMMKNLAESFAAERGRLETQLGQTGSTTTETLRVSLRRYRSFFERLLSL